MTAENFITGSCIITRGRIYSSGQRVFESKNATLPEFLLNIYKHFELNYPKFHKMDNLGKLGWLTAEILLKDIKLSDSYQPEDIGIILANTNSSLDTDLKYYQTISEVPSPSVFVYTLPNIVIGEICIRNHIKGEHAFFIQDKFDAVFITQQVNYLLDHNIIQACICGWADVLGDEYKAALFLIEKDKKADAVNFCADTINQIFNLADQNNI